MKTAFIFLVFLPSLAVAQAPPSPIAQAVAKLQTDAATYDAASGSLSVATKAVATLSVAASTAQAAVAADMATLAALTGTPVPSPAPTPIPSGPTVSILAITDTATCVPCRLLQPTLTAFQAAGVQVQYLSGGDSTAVSKWKVSSTPTMIMLVNGVETPANSRIVGWQAKTDASGKPVLDAAGNLVPYYDFTGWYQNNVIWAKAHPNYPNP
jgi:hypothetical protein